MVVYELFGIFLVGVNSAKTVKNLRASVKFTEEEIREQPPVAGEVNDEIVRALTSQVPTPKATPSDEPIVVADDGGRGQEWRQHQQKRLLNNPLLHRRFFNRSRNWQTRSPRVLRLCRCIPRTHQILQQHRTLLPQQPHSDSSKGDW